MQEVGRKLLRVLLHQYLPITTSKKISTDYVGRAVRAFLCFQGAHGTPYTLPLHSSRPSVKTRYYYQTIFSQLSRTVRKKKRDSVPNWEFRDP
jgi:hypothetical protein